MDRNESILGMLEPINRDLCSRCRVHLSPTRLGSLRPLLNPQSPMTPEQRTKIEDGVVACLDRCRGGSPCTALSAFLNELRASPDWHVSEIIELQTWLIRLLNHKDCPVGGHAVR